MRRIFHLALFLWLTTVSAYASDVDVFDSIAKMLETHWKLEAHRHNEDHRENLTSFVREKTQALQDVVKASGGRIDTNQLEKLLEPSLDGKAPDWDPLKKLFANPDAYFVASYLEPAKLRNSSTDPQVVSGELGRIRRHQVKEVDISGKIERVEVYYLSPRANTYAGIQSGTKKAGSFVRPGLAVLEENLVKDMAATPWKLRQKLETRFGKNIKRAEEETVYRIKSGFDGSEAVIALLTWRQLMGSTMSATELAMENWLIDQSAYRTRMLNDEDFLEGIKGLEPGSPTTSAIQFLSTFGAMAHSDTPLFLLCHEIQSMEIKDASGSNARANSAMELFASYIVEQASSYPNLDMSRPSSDKYLIMPQLSRLTMKEIRELTGGFYQQLELSWLLNGVIARAFKEKFDVPYMERLERRSRVPAEQSVTILAELAAAYHVNGNVAEAKRTFDELYERIQKSEKPIGHYGRHVVARSLDLYAVTCYDGKHFEKAAEIYKTIFRLNEYYTPGYFMYARVQINLGDLRGALASCENFLKYEALKPEELRVHALTQDVNEMKERLEKILEQNK